MTFDHRNSYEGETILVTGGAGRLVATFVEPCRSGAATVIILDDLSASYPGISQIYRMCFCEGQHLQ